MTPISNAVNPGEQLVKNSMSGFLLASQIVFFFFKAEVKNSDGYLVEARGAVSKKKDAASQLIDNILPLCSPVALSFCSVQSCVRVRSWGLMGTLDALGCWPCTSLPAWPAALATALLFAPAPWDADV